MAYEAERTEAKRLALESDLDVEDIQKRMPQVSIQTLYRWKKEDNWVQEREEVSLTSFSAMKQMLSAATTGLEEIAKDLKANGMAGFDSQKSFALLRFLKDVKAMQKDIDSYGNILLAIQELTEFLGDRDPEVLDKLQPLLIEFGTAISKKYGKK